MYADEAIHLFATCGVMDCFAFARNDGCSDYGGGTFVIGLRCASAATVDVPIGPFSS